MEKISAPPFSYTAKAYCLLTKPGIIMGNMITMAGGFALASRGYFNVLFFCITLAGLSLIIASACVFNNFIDRDFDKKMNRTKNRPLVKGLISGKSALVFAVILGFLGSFCLLHYTNLLTFAIALFGFFVYVLLYSFSKYRTVHGTLIGSVAGAVPPVVGYCSVNGSFDVGALIIFAIVAIWQMPHFFAIAIYRLDDYAAASIPVMPIKKGILTTKFHMLFYIILFIAASFMLTIFGFTGLLFLIASAILGFRWLWICIEGFQTKNDTLWARKMFLFSLIVITTLCLVIPFSVRERTLILSKNDRHPRPIHLQEIDRSEPVL